MQATRAGRRRVALAVALLVGLSLPCCRGRDVADGHGLSDVAAVSDHDGRVEGARVVAHGGGSGSDAGEQMRAAAPGESNSDALSNDPIADQFHAHEFLPEHLLAFDLIGATEECLFESVSEAALPTQIRAAFFVESGGDMRINAALYPGVSSDAPPLNPPPASPAAPAPSAIPLYETMYKAEGLVMADIKVRMCDGWWVVGVGCVVFDRGG